MYKKYGFNWFKGIENWSIDDIAIIFRYHANFSDVDQFADEFWSYFSSIGGTN